MMLKSPDVNNYIHNVNYMNNNAFKIWSDGTSIKATHCYHVRNNEDHVGLRRLRDYKLENLMEIQ